MVLTPDEKTAYLQVSFFHGIVEFKLRAKDPTGGGDYVSGGVPEPAAGRVKRLIPLPISDEAAALTREEYVLDSAHHGIAINERGTRLCVAGTMSDYAAIVNRKTGRSTIFDGKAKFLPNRTYSKPYWATTSKVDGNCWVSMAGSDLVMVIDYRKRRVIGEIAVGEHPQRVRDGVVGRPVLRAWKAGGASGLPDLSPVPISSGPVGRSHRVDGSSDRGHQLGAARPRAARPPSIRAAVAGSRHARSRLRSSAARAARPPSIRAAARLYQALGRLPWLAFFFLRARRLRPVLLMRILLRRKPQSDTAGSRLKNRSETTTTRVTSPEPTTLPSPPR